MMCERWEEESARASSPRRPLRGAQSERKASGERAESEFAPSAVSRQPLAVAVAVAPSLAAGVGSLALVAPARLAATPSFRPCRHFFRPSAAPSFRPPLAVFSLGLGRRPKKNGGRVFTLGLGSKSGRRNEGETSRHPPPAMEPPPPPPPTADG